MAPEVRVTSRPSVKRTRVGMLRIAYRAVGTWASSVLTFTRHACGSTTRAASSNAGAIIRHGPHQGAWKSTTRGSWLRSMWYSAHCSFRAKGTPEKSAARHFPHLAPPRGTRLTASHSGQTTWTFDISVSFRLLSGAGACIRTPLALPENPERRTRLNRTVAHLFTGFAQDSNKE